MTTKLHRYFRIVLLVFLVITLTSCATAVTSTPTETPVPKFTFTPVPPTTTPTLDFAPVSATPIPTQPPFVPAITPDAIQVERWRDYQTALAKGILPMFPFESILCEWDILARSGQEVYVWAVCASTKGDDTRPAVIHLGIDGSVQSVEIPRRNSSDIDKMFPEVAQVKFGLYIGDSIFRGRLKEIYSHIEYRRTHPEEPPLIVLSATPTATPTP